MEGVRTPEGIFEREGLIDRSGLGAIGPELLRRAMATGRAAHQFSQTAPEAQIEVAKPAATVAAVESPSTDVTTLMPFRSKST
jgi:hypothetical protein